MEVVRMAGVETSGCDINHLVSVDKPKGPKDSKGTAKA